MPSFDSIFSLRIGMNPTLVLNEDEKKERFKKHLNKKVKIRSDEGAIFNHYPINVDLFHQHVIFNTPFWNFDEPSRFNFDRQSLLNGESGHSPAEMYNQTSEPIIFNFKPQDVFNRDIGQTTSEVREASEIAQETVAANVVEPFVFYNENPGTQADEDLAAESAICHDDFQSRHINSENFLPFPRQRILLSTHFVDNTENGKVSKNELIKASESKENKDKHEANMVSVPNLDMIQECFIKDIFNLRKTSEFSPETQQRLDSNKYSHKKFGKCTDEQQVDQLFEESSKTQAG